MIRAGRFVFDTIGDGLAVADLPASRIVMLNSSAALGWMELISGPRSVEELALIFRNQPPPRGADVEQGVRALLQELEGYGWIRCDGGGRWIVQQEGTPSYGGKLCPPLDMEDVPSEVLWSRSIRVSSSVVKLEVSGPVHLSLAPEFQRMVGMLSGLPTAPEALAQARIGVSASESRVELTSGSDVGIFPDILVASGALNEWIIRRAYPHCSAHTLFHAATVSKAGGSIILPALSGSGKSTLTAYLVARGWCYGGDDIIALARGKGNGSITLLPFTTALGVKEGSVEILAPHFSGLAALEVLPYGSKSVRYLSIPSDRHTPEGEEWRRPRAIVFPAYQANASFEITELTAWEALSLILEAGAGAGGGTDVGLLPETFELLLDLVRTVPRLRMSYSSLPEVAGHLEALF